MSIRVEEWYTRAESGVRIPVTPQPDDCWARHAQTGQHCTRLYGHGQRHHATTADGAVLAVWA